MDHAKRRDLIETIRRRGFPSAGQPCPVVSLEEFFEGNDDAGSIGCNLKRHPGVNRFFSILRKIRKEDDVQDVLIEIAEVGESDESTWPSSQRVFVITRASQRAVETWFFDLQPSAVEAGRPLPSTAPRPGDGYTVFAAWWD